MAKNPEVDAWFKTYDNPQKAAVQRVRMIILKADKRMGECIKWQAPTFTYEGNLASFFPKAKKHVTLMFHTGASIPGKHPLLQGGGGTSRTMTFADLADVEKKKKALESLVKAWIELKSSGAKKKTSKKKTTTKKKVVAKKVTKKTAAKKVVAKKTTKKAASKKVVKKSPAKKKAASKKVVKKAPAKKKAASKKVVKKAPAKKAAKKSPGRR